MLLHSHMTYTACCHILTVQAHHEIEGSGRQLCRIKRGTAKSVHIMLFAEGDILQCHVRHKCLPLLFFIATFGCTSECTHLCVKTTHVKGPNIAMNKQIIKK